MCTAAAYKTKDFYFGRTFDYGFSYGEEVTVTPRNYPFTLRHGGSIKGHYAIIGIAHVKNGYPLYYDAVNEKGLCIAGLNFVGNAYYGKPVSDRKCITQFELIPSLLCRCSTVKEARAQLEEIRLSDTPFDDTLPVPQLHWLIADRNEALTVEPLKNCMTFYRNPVGLLTNNPPFDKQLFSLNNYMHLSPSAPENRFASELSLEAYSRGMGAVGLPGDLSSQSRFIRAAFVKMNSVSGEGEKESVGQFFHILGSVEQQRGCCDIGNGEYEITQYTSCCNADRGIYYYTTYGNRRITAVDMYKEALDGKELIRYPLVCDEQIEMQN